MGKLYGSTDITRKTGLSKIQIHYAIILGAIEPYENKTGRGSRRVFNEENLRQFRVYQRLIRIGLPVCTIGEIIVRGSNDLTQLEKSVVDFHRIFCKLMG